MKKNEKYDKVITDFDLDFVKNKFDDDGVVAPDSLSSENVKNAIDKKEQKIIPFVKSKAFKTAVSLVACVAIVAVSLNFALGKNTQSPPVADTQIESKTAQFKTFSSAKDVKNYFTQIGDWFKQSDMGNQAPRDKKLIWDSAVDALKHPAFAILEGNKAFEHMKERLKGGRENG